MDDKRTNTALPPKPEWFITTVAKMAIIYAAAGAVIGAIGSKIPGLKIIYDGGVKNELMQGAMLGGALGGVLGAMSSAADHATYPLEIQNAQLSNQVRQLKNDKSFAQQILQDKQEPQSRTLG